VTPEDDFGEFYRANARSLWAYVYRSTGNAADADDITQEAFCRLLRAEHAPAANEERRRYLFRIAGNLMADRWRREARDRSLDHESSHSEPAAARPTNTVLPRLFGRLKARDRAMLWLAYVEEADQKEIARSLGLSPASVKVLLSRARGRLRTLLIAAGMVTRTPNDVA
jgi:RNA polymerase sigma-70 factor, ECF subfamily